MLGTTNVRSPRRPAVFWLIAKREDGREEEILTLDLDDRGETLPVFCFEDEASIFLSLGAIGAGWYSREATSGELSRMLLSSSTDIGFVSLDPLPELAHPRMIGLVSMSKERFVARLIEDAWSRDSTDSENIESPSAY